MKRNLSIGPILDCVAIRLVATDIGDLRMQHVSLRLGYRVKRRVTSKHLEDKIQIILVERVAVQELNQDVSGRSRGEPGHKPHRGFVHCDSSFRYRSSPKRGQ
jgi:hypothetical protein